MTFEELKHLSGCSRSRSEATERRRLEGRLRFANLPSPKTLAEVDYDAQPALDRRLVTEFAMLRFVEERGNVLVIGPRPRRDVARGYRVYYPAAADFVTKTQRAALEGRWQTTVRFSTGPSS